MRLFYVPNTCAISPHITLRELGMSFKLDRIDLKAGKKTQAGESFMALNPKGYVPALELDDGTLLTEGAVMVQYLADQKPEAKLAPPNGTLARVRLQEMLHFIATELHKPLSPLYQAAAPDDFKAWWKQNKVEPRFDYLAKVLEGRRYVMGDSFTVADPYAFYVLRAYTSSLKQDLSKWRVLQDYFAHMSERPSVIAAIAADV